MTDKQARFCEEYMIDLNATQAAIRAGYSPKTANEQAARLLANVSIQNRIAQLQAEQSRRTGVSADRVVRELAKVAFVNAGDLIDARTASLKSDAAPDDLAAVQSVKVKTFGEDGLEQEVKLADKLKPWICWGGIWECSTACPAMPLISWPRPQDPRRSRQCYRLSRKNILLPVHTGGT